MYHPGSQQGQQHVTTMPKAQSYLNSANELTLEFSKRVLSPELEILLHNI